MESFECLLPFRSAFTKCFFRLVLQLLLDAVDLMHSGPDLFDRALILGADDFTNNPIEHNEQGESEVREKDV